MSKCVKMWMVWKRKFGRTKDIVFTSHATALTYAKKHRVRLKPVWVCEKTGKRVAKRSVLRLSGTRRGITVDRERLDRGGYTSSGRYFGVGEPLYAWWSEELGEGGHVRAKNAKEAREKVEFTLKMRRRGDIMRPMRGRR